MNILVIGNGFDLAHGLPTRYIDFIRFLKYFQLNYLDKTWKIDSESFKDLNENVKELLKNKEVSKFDYEADIWNKLNKEINKNVWVQFFITKIQQINEDDGWIDCEKEIAEIIKAVDYKIKIVRYKKSHGEIDRKKINKVKDFIAHEFIELYKSKSDPEFNNYWENSGHEKLVKGLQKDLDGFIWCLEVYLVYIIEKLDIKVKDEDINRIANNIDAVLSFNYTDTYRKVYNRKINCDFIHGQAVEGKENNMVLGIDEYLNKENKNTDLDFIYFKKYFQRLYKKTSFEYKTWIENMKTERNELKLSLYKLEEIIKAKEKLLLEKEAQMNIVFHIKEKSELIAKRRKILEQLKKENNIYIFGHSLDITDKDILRKLILGYDYEEDKDEGKSYNAKITIFYCDKEVYIQQITHLVEIIGQDELIRRTTGPNKSIIFIEQK